MTSTLIALQYCFLVRNKKIIGFMHAQQYILIEQKILLSDVVKYAKLQIQISFSYTFFSGCW
jgi:hypothetical protein